jgi:hypothetical protein
MKYKYDIGDVVQLKDQIHFDYPFQYAGKIAIIVGYNESGSGYWAIISGEGNKKQYITHIEIYKKL